MENAIIDAALSQGIWAVVAVFLLVYIVKSNEKRDLKQAEREANYQRLLNELTEKFSILNHMQTNIDDIKKYIQKQE